jgi:hypothetical protein
MTLSPPYSADLRALCVFDDGSGPALYAGGQFTNAGGTAAINLARWNGSAWAAVGWASYPVSVLSVADDGSGSGPRLYLGTSGLFRLDSGAWTWLGVSGFIYAIAGYDDGSGQALYVGGGNVHTAAIGGGSTLRWQNGSWSTLAGDANGDVYSFAAFDDGSGLALYASGDLTNTVGSITSGIERWNGATWSGFARGLSGGSGGFADGHAMTLYDDGGGPALCVAGQFTGAGATAVHNVARWNGTWSSLGVGGNGISAAVQVFLSDADSGGAPQLYAGGWFGSAGSVAAQYIARWDGTSWHPLGNGTYRPLDALAFWDDGNGKALYAGAAWIGTNILQRWNGTSWSDVGVAPSNWFNTGPIYAIAAFDDGVQSALYVAGGFTSVGNLPCSGGIVRWDGSHFSTLGLCVIGGNVRALTVFDDGSGSALYAAGPTNSSPGHFSYVGRWNGHAWQALGDVAEPIYSVKVWDDGHGGGPALYAAGDVIGGVIRWNGASWTVLGAGINDGTRRVYSIEACDDGTGPALYAAVGYVLPVGVDGFDIMRWDGSSWSALVNAQQGFAYTLGVHDDGSSQGPDLFVGGMFTSIGGVAASDIARRDGCAQPFRPTCAGDGTQGACPCGNSGSTGAGCANSQTSGATLAARGTTLPDTVVLSASGMLANATCVFLQGDVQIAPVSFGDGLRCAGGSLVRLIVHHASSGSSSFPVAGELGIRARSASVGHPIWDGQSRIYQTCYRDPDPSFCPPPSGATWNITSGVVVAW